MTRCFAAAVAVAVVFAAPLSAYAARNFPANALRGSLTVETPPQVLLNKKPTKLAPGARIHGENNLNQVSNALRGRTLAVNYLQDAAGVIHEVWVLTPEEAARSPWPSTPEQAKTWRFDYTNQTWTKP